VATAMAGKPKVNQNYSLVGQLAQLKLLYAFKQILLPNKQDSSK